MSNKARKTRNRLVLLRSEAIGVTEGWDDQLNDSNSVFIRLDAAYLDETILTIDEIIETHRLETREMRFLDSGLELRFRRRQDAMTFRAVVRAMPSIEVPEG